MKPSTGPLSPPTIRFRLRVLAAMMAVVSAVVVAGLWFAQRNLAATVRNDLQRVFQVELAALHLSEAVRNAALAERCRALVRRPRIHAALEDNALDLLYPSAEDEMRDIREDRTELAEGVPYALHAQFYRFLDHRGTVIVPPADAAPGSLPPREESALNLTALPERAQIGFLPHDASAGETPVVEIIAMPIVSTETGDFIAALVLGFRPAGLDRAAPGTDLKRGVWVQGQLFLPALIPSARTALTDALTRAVPASGSGEGSVTVASAGAPNLVFFKLLNPASAYPPAYEICVFPLTDWLVQQRRLRWQFVVAGCGLFVSALAVSRLFSGRLAAPVERLAKDSETNRLGRRQAEVALEATSEELQRSIRFSADASHQLKTPVTVLRAGLEELLATENLPPLTREEISGLVHETFRLTSIIEDLLLLSRMDAGRLQIDFVAVDLVAILAALLDDLAALPDPLALTVETDFPGVLIVSAEKRYATLILQNLLENARKYNRPAGRIHFSARCEGPWAIVAIGNTGSPIPVAAQGHIFERFHRGAVGEDIPGHGLGLNLARLLIRLHGGELRLNRSDEAWTEFEARFHLAGTAPLQPLSPP